MIHMHVCISSPCIRRAGVNTLNLNTSISITRYDTSYTVLFVAFQYVQQAVIDMSSLITILVSYVVHTGTDVFDI
jgi:hypothetical protein